MKMAVIKQIPSVVYQNILLIKKRTIGKRIIILGRLCNFFLLLHENTSVIRTRTLLSDTRREDSLKGMANHR